jgi:curved DNA-binding protein CbpA
VPNLPTGTNNFDPFSVLHLDRDADAEQARRAFVELSKVYHPDRFATVELPPEVSHYLAAMARRINVAYEEVQDAIKGREQLAADRHEPIFTKAG